MSLQNGYACSLINTVITSYNFVSYYKILKIILCCTLIFGTILVMLFLFRCINSGSPGHDISLFVKVTYKKYLLFVE